MYCSCSESSLILLVFPVAEARGEWCCCHSSTSLKQQALRLTHLEGLQAELALLSPLCLQIASCPLYPQVPANKTVHQKASAANLEVAARSRSTLRWAAIILVGEKRLWCHQGSCWGLLCTFPHQIFRNFFLLHLFPATLYSTSILILMSPGPQWREE